MAQVSTAPAHGLKAGFDHQPPRHPPPQLRPEVSSEERVPTGEDGHRPQLGPHAVCRHLCESPVSPELVLMAGGACWVHVVQYVPWE